MLVVRRSRSYDKKGGREIDLGEENINPMSLLECQDVTYFYKNTTKGIQHVTFRAYPGDCIAVIGKNGAGKSTFLNMVSGITTPCSGTISCSPEINYHDLGFCSQRQSIDWYLNVYDNVRLGAMLAGMRAKDADQATKTVMELMDLESYEKTAPDGLSGGQQQRLQVARAIVHHPKIMVLDEPTSGLDFHYSKKLFEYLYTRCKEAGSMMLVSSHDLTLIEDYCDKILFFENGEQKFFGQMQDFKKEHPVSKQVRILYQGRLEEATKQQLSRFPIVLEEGAVSFLQNRNIDMNEIIQILLKEVTIVNIQSEQVSLRDILAQREEQYEEKSDLYENGQTGDPRSLGDHQ